MPHGAATLGSELEITLRLLGDLVRELRGNRPLDTAAFARAQAVVVQLQQRPNLQELPGIMLRVSTEVTEALNGIRATRETIQSYSLERLKDTHARLSEVSSTTESAAMEMLNGLDRTLALIDTLESGVGAASGFDALRGEVNQLYGHLQFQDIITQQLRGVTALLAELEGRLQAVASLFDPGQVRAAVHVSASPDPESYNAEASANDVAGRQALIDAAFSAARGAA